MIALGRNAKGGWLSWCCSSWIKSSLGVHFEFYLEGGLPTWSRRLLARKYSAEGALQSVRLYLEHQSRASRLPTRSVFKFYSVRLLSPLCSLSLWILSMRSFSAASLLCREGLTQHVATQLVVVYAGDSLLGLAREINPAPPPEPRMQSV